MRISVNLPLLFLGHNSSRLRPSYNMFVTVLEMNMFKYFDILGKVPTFRNFGILSHVVPYRTLAAPSQI